MNSVILKRRSALSFLLLFFFMIALHLLLASSAEAVEFTGYVTDSANDPIANAKVILFNTTSAQASETVEANWGTMWDITDDTGEYSITNLDSDTYKLKVVPPVGYISEWWDNKTDYDQAMSHSGGIASFSLTTDNDPPIGTVDIDPGDATSLFYNVTLTLSAIDVLSDVKQMRFSHDSGSTWVAWEPYETSRNWVLQSIEGQDPEVSVQFKDGAGNVSSAESDEVSILGPMVDDIDFGSIGNGGNAGDVAGESVVTIPRGDRDFTISLELDPSCQGPVPSVEVPINGVPEKFDLVKQAGNTYVAEITGNVTEGDIKLYIYCPLETTTVIGSIELIDPSGIISNKDTGDPIEGATVSLYRLNPFTSQYEFMDPTVGLNSLLMDPDINPQSSGSDGWYGWDVAAGSYYVAVEKGGYYDVDQSRIVVIPPPVLDLDIELTPIPTGVNNNLLLLTGLLMIGSGGLFIARRPISFSKR